MMRDKAIESIMKIKTKRSIKWVNDAETKYQHGGIHLIADFWDGKTIDSEKEIKEILIKTAEKANCKALKTNVHKFEPQGVTGVVLLEESHITIHCWPEYNYVAIDLFTCGDKSAPDKALGYLKEVFVPKRFETKKIKRGKI